MNSISITNIGSNYNVLLWLSVQPDGGETATGITLTTGMLDVMVLKLVV